MLLQLQDHKVGQIICMLPLCSLSLTDLEVAKAYIEQMTDEEKRILLGNRSSGGSGARAFKDTNFISFLEEIVAKNEKEPEVSVRVDDAENVRFDYNTKLLEKLEESERETESFIRNPVRILGDIKWVANTIRKIYENVLTHQQEYILSGDHKKLKPLSQEDIAEKIGISPSMVSRLTNDRTIRTPRSDVIYLKSLFVSQDEINKLHVYEIIAPMIRDGRYPTNDGEATRIVNEQTGLNLKRRTIAKYRKTLETYFESRYLN